MRLHDAKFMRAVGDGQARRRGQSNGARSSWNEGKAVPQKIENRRKIEVENTEEMRLQNLFQLALFLLLCNAHVVGSIWDSWRSQVPGVKSVFLVTRVRGGFDESEESLEEANRQMAEAALEEATQTDPSRVGIPTLRPFPRPFHDDIKIPGDFHDIVKALVTCKNQSSFFVEDGSYHWDELSTPNSTGHAEEDLPKKNDAVDGTVYVANTISLRGHPKAEIWGRLVFLASSTGICKYITLASDSRGSDPGWSTVFIVGRSNSAWGTGAHSRVRAWQFHECQLRSAGAVAVGLAGRGRARMYECGIGGVGSLPTTEAQVGLLAFENASCSLHACAVRSNLVSGYAASLASQSLTMCRAIVANYAVFKAFESSFALNMHHIKLGQSCKVVKLHRCELHDSHEASFKVETPECHPGQTLGYSVACPLEKFVLKDSCRPTGLTEIQNEYLQGMYSTAGRVNVNMVAEGWTGDMSKLNSRRKMLGENDLIGRLLTVILLR
eukprot:766024-Hanusia_phi.AAC.4